MMSSSNELDLRPLSARSVMLSTLLGTPHALPVQTLVRVGQLFDISDGTTRVALSRLLAAGDVTGDAGVYRLAGERLLDRQRRQRESRAPRTRPWNRAWSVAVVTAAPRSHAERATVRSALVARRYAALRSGTWTRPSNLVSRPAGQLGDQCHVFEGAFQGDDVMLARTLWDLDGWANTARALLGAMESAASPAQRFTVAAGILRHLLSDPLLPTELLPAAWPGSALRDAYDRFAEEFAELITAAVRSRGQ